jgi:hypothetical protein
MSNVEGKTLRNSEVRCSGRVKFHTRTRNIGILEEGVAAPTSQRRVKGDQG